MPMTNSSASPSTGQRSSDVSNVQSNQAPTTDAEKCNSIQGRLALLLYAQKCQKCENESNGEAMRCSVRQCITMKHVLSHMTCCTAGELCPVPHCSSSRSIMSHWQNCMKYDCRICVPIRQTLAREERAESQKRKFREESESSKTSACTESQKRKFREESEPKTSTCTESPKKKLREESESSKTSTCTESSKKKLREESESSKTSTCTESSKKKLREESESSKTSTCTGYDSGLKQSVPLSVNKMLRDLKELFLKQENCDVTIKVKEQEFRAHKAILIARSPVFAATFRNDMKEKATGVVEIDDCNPSSFSDFLCFLYCGGVEILTTENVYDLFIAADKYDVEDLQSECLEFMKRNLSVDTFCETVTVAFQHLKKELLNLSTDFFAKHLQEIIVTVKWQRFLIDYPVQANEILIKALVPKK